MYRKWLRAGLAEGGLDAFPAGNGLLQAEQRQTASDPLSLDACQAGGQLGEMLAQLCVR